MTALGLGPFPRDAARPEITLMGEGPLAQFLGVANRVRFRFDAP